MDPDALTYCDDCETPLTAADEADPSVFCCDASHAKKLRGQMDRLSAHNAKLTDIARSAHDLYSFMWPDGKWRGEANMKGIIKPAAELKFAFQRFEK